MPEHSQPSLLGSLWRFRGMSVAVVLGMIVLTFLVTTQTSPGATATATLGLRTPSSDNVLAPGVQGDASLGRYTAQRARFINSDATMNDVAERVASADATAVRGRLLVTASQTSNYITVKAEGDTAADAVALADAVVGAYRDQTASQVAVSTDAAVSAIQSQIDVTLQNAEGSAGAVSDAAATTVSGLQAEIAALRTSQAIYGDGVEFVVIPDVESAVTRGLPIRSLALGAIVGLAIAMSLAWWRADRDQRVNRWQDAEAILRTPLLASAAQSGPVVPAQPTELAKMPNRTYDLLWESVWERVPEGIIVVQPIGPGRTCDVTLNLAAAAAREDLRVLVIDAGMSHANTTVRLGQDQGLTGLRESLRAGEDWRRHVVDIKVPRRYNYEMLPTGPSSDEYVATSRVRACIDEWREAYDYIFIDAEPLGSTPLSSKLTAAADAVVPVVGRGAQTPQLVEFRRQVEVLEATMIGFAFTEQASLFRQQRKPTSGRSDRDDAEPADRAPVHANAS
jgi:Mrp family chromosome partitioning ATPase